MITTSQPIRSTLTHWTHADKHRTSLISGDLLPCIFNLQSHSYGKQMCHHPPVRFDVKRRWKRLGSKRMCIHRRSFLHSVLQNSCLNCQQRRIKATAVTRTAAWSWSQTAQATRQVLLRLQVKRTRLSGNVSSDLEIIANNTAAAAPIYVTLSSESEEQDNEFSRLPLL